MSSLSPRRALFALFVFSAVPLLAACPKEKVVVPFDAGPPPAPVDTTPVNLEPLADEAGVDAGVDAGPKKYGPAVNPNVARLKQCCNQLAIQAKAMGSSPEAGMFSTAAAQCNTIAAQAGPTGTAPEMGVIRGLLAGRTIPAACAGF